MTKTVRLLHHPSSQPCRAVHQFMLETDIPFEQEIVNIIDGVNEQQEFKDKYNPTGQVPILVDDDFVVWESAAIASYLNEKYDVAPNWFGATMQSRAMVHQYLHWHSTTLRRGAGAFFYSHFAECIWGTRDYSREIEKGRYILYESMAMLQDYWLDGRDYVCGDEISFADLQGYHEFVSHIAGQIIPADVWSKYDRVKDWCDRMGARPHSPSGNATIMEIGEIRLSGKIIPMNRRTSLAKGTELVGGHTTGIPYLTE
ncbi:MAG: glutathione S-transferase family protein [Sandaracinaceae bacterium]